ncbi:MAG TPA: ferritin-like domain-containing protein [Polyangiaceae bacterium]|nr:ferritin-like domain-containing protein [Polyangiaceae bacterium]
MLALGAPAELVRDVHRALGDEIEHAELCFSIASGLGASVGPGPIPWSADLGPRTTAAEVARATVIEGCIGESIAALVAQLERDAAAEPVVRRALERIAEDEARHAQLAWRTVAWLLRSHGAAVREAVTRAFIEGTRCQLEVASDDRLPAQLGRRFGRLPPRELRSVAARCLRDVIAPAAQTLLGERDHAWSNSLGRSVAG